MSVPFLESLLSAKIKSLLTTGIPASGGIDAIPAVTFPVMTFWEDGEEGEVKEDRRSKISIGINPRGYNDQVGWSSTFTGWLSIEWDGPDTRELAAEYNRMMQIMEQCQHAAAGASVALLDVDGFNVDDFQLLPGGDCGLDTNEDVFFALVNFELDGILTTR